MSLARWLERHAAFTPDKAAIRTSDQSLTYAQLSARASRLAGGLARELGVGPGDRVAFLGFNHPDMLALLFACARLGAILVPLNWRLAAPEHQAVLTDADASVLVGEADFREHVEQLRLRFARMRLVASGFAHGGWLELDALTAGAGGGETDTDDGTPVLIVYTSGTTGQPKGAVLSQGALFWNAVNSQHMHDLTSTDHVLTVLPLFHVGGLNIQTLPALHAGASVTLHRRFEPGATLEAIVRDRPSLTVLVPATMRALIGHRGWPNADLSSLRMVTTGSQIVPTELIEAFHRRGVPVAQVYGSTETGPVAVYQRREDAERSVGSTGKPALHCDVRLVDDHGADVPIGTQGEILVRGPNVATHYWRNPDATREALQGGWFRTGDIGHIDAAGNLWIDARRDDLIKSGGERLYPAEIENLLRAVPGVRDAVVVGRPDPTWGEVPIAFVVAEAGQSPTLTEISAELDGRVARFKQPKAILLVDDLPRNALGKVLRYRLRAMAEDGSDG